MSERQECTRVRKQLAAENTYLLLFPYAYPRPRANVEDETHTARHWPRLALSSAQNTVPDVVCPPRTAIRVLLQPRPVQIHRREHVEHHWAPHQSTPTVYTISTTDTSTTRRRNPSTRPPLLALELLPGLTELARHERWAAGWLPTLGDRVGGCSREVEQTHATVYVKVAKRLQGQGEYCLLRICASAAFSFGGCGFQLQRVHCGRLFAVLRRRAYSATRKGPAAAVESRIRRQLLLQRGKHLSRTGSMTTKEATRCHGTVTKRAQQHYSHPR
ncbi:hypothetical protein DFH06DRAFT_676459 [Mycena polygramma]|nr:hypothetical protein DFH06DRAFT_676459 [Mycena polygramma]